MTLAVEDCSEVSPGVCGRGRGTVLAAGGTSLQNLPAFA